MIAPCGHRGDSFVPGWAAAPGIIGYDVFNEPSPGSATDMREMIGLVHPEGAHPTFDAERLFPFHQRVLDAVREVDADLWVFVEPRYGAPANGLPSYHPTLTDPRPGPARVAYAPHLYSIAYERDQHYDPTADTSVADWERERGVELGRAPMPLLLGEWGFDWTFPGADLYGRAILDMADRMRAGWAYWSYSENTWGLWDGADERLTAANAVVRPYPRAVAGVPVAFGYDADTRVFRLELEAREGITGPTEIYLAAARHYPEGFTVSLPEAEGAWTQVWDAEREVLAITGGPAPGGLSITRPGTEPGGRHVIEVRPATP